MPSSSKTSRTTTSRSGASSGRANASARNEIIAMLKDDHKRAKKAFRDFERMQDKADSESCQQLVEQVCNELTLHSTLEEELLYPAAKDALPEADLVNEAEVEHGSAKALIEQLKGMSPEDEKYAATFMVLGEYVKHHIKEEENEMFPQLGKARGVEWETIADEMTGRREELMQELMPEDIEAEEQGDDAEPTRAASAAGAARQSAQGGRASEGRAQAASGKQRGRSRPTDVKSDSEEVGGESD